MSGGGARWKAIRASLPLSVFLSPASANICNVVLMRYGELEEGIDVLDADGNLVGSSKIAARHVGFPGAKPCTNGSMRPSIACMFLEVFWSQDLGLLL